MLGNEGITFADFCNYTKTSHYCGIRQNDKLIGRHKIYSVSSGVTDKGGVSVIIFFIFSIFIIIC